MDGWSSYSNFRAATMLGKPDTTPTISQGRSLFRAVRTAPPLALPLCWFSRRGGWGVEPMYSDPWRTVLRRT